jgi:hypothetical protein
MIYRNVYMPKGQEITATTRAVAAWLWSGRAATAAGLSAAALHGSKWIDAALPAELTRSSARNVDGIVIHRERLDDDEAGVVCAEYRRPLPPVPHTTSVGGTVLRKRSSGLTRWRTRPASNPMTSMSWSSDTAVPGALYTSRLHIRQQRSRRSSNRSHNKPTRGLGTRPRPSRVADQRHASQRDRLSSPKAE